MPNLNFIEDPLQSNRSRNWFKVNWKLYNLKLNYKPSENNHHSLSIFGLDAERFALGYRSNRVAQSDPIAVTLGDDTGIRLTPFMRWHSQLDAQVSQPEAQAKKKTTHITN